MSKTNEAQRHYRQTGTILIIVTILALWLLIGGFPIVISQSNTIFPTEAIIGDTVNPIANIDENDCKIVLKLANDDKDRLPKVMRKRSVLVCTDPNVIEQIKEHFEFIVTGGDMATVESELWVFSQGNLVLKTGFVIDTFQIGMQNEYTGWTEASDYEALVSLFGLFKPCRQPLILVR